MLYEFTIWVFDSTLRLDNDSILFIRRRNFFVNKHLSFLNGTYYRIYLVGEIESTK